MHDLFLRLLALPPQASSVAAGIDALHLVIISITTVSACAVFAFVIYCVWRFKGTGHVSTRLEWSKRAEIIPAAALLVLFLGWWVVGFEQYAAIQVPPRTQQDIYVTGKQWMWKFVYPDGRSSINKVTVPQGKPVKLVMISRDVIHSFFVPAFRIKQDVLPARYTSLWFQADKPGSYDVLCAEYCGLEHARMRAEIEVLEPAAYAAWQKSAHQPEDPTINAGGQVLAVDPSPSLAAQGARAAHAHGCINCHSEDGQTTLGPTFKGLWNAERKLQDGATVRADGAYLSESIMDPMAKIVAGYAAVMPSYWGIVDASDTAALVEYIKSLRDEGTSL